MRSAPAAYRVRRVLSRRHSSRTTQLTLPVTSLGVPNLSVQPESHQVPQLQQGPKWFNGKTQNHFSSSFARCQQHFATACFGWGGGGPTFKSPFSWCVRDPHLTQCSLDRTSVPAKWHQNPSNGLSRVHECDRRQTDHAMEKCVATGGIACTIRSDST